MYITLIESFSEVVYEAVKRLLPQLNPAVPVPSGENVKELIESPHNHFFIAENENEIAGMATLVEYRIPTGKKFWIEDVVVDGGHRNEGVGHLLVLSAIRHAGELGATEVRLTSRPGRVEANKLYRNMGFVQYETNVYKYSL